METAFEDKDLMTMCEVPGATTQRMAVVPLQVPVHAGSLLAPGSHSYWGQQWEVRPPKAACDEEHPMATGERWFLRAREAFGKSL